MNKDIYTSLINWLKKHNINRISYDVFLQFETSQINYSKIFEKLNVSSNFYLFQIDNFIKKDDTILKKYKENIIFQYSYLILSSYVFKNKAELVESLDTVHKSILTCQYEQLDIFLKSPKINKIIDKEFNNTIGKINKFINNPIYVSYIQKIYNSKQNLGNLCHSNIFEVHSIITNTLKMLFVHQGNVDLIDFLKSIKKINIDEYSINLLKQKCRNSKVNFFEYMLNYYNNRFFYHGTSSKWLNSIKKFGLNGIHNFKYQNEITKAINIFEEHGIYKTFEGKNKVGYLNYYVTDSIGSAVYYSHQSPEYLSRFCSNGDCMKLLEKCDDESFWRRDYDTCLNNVQELCKSTALNKKDTSFVTSLFKKLWKEEVKKDQIPIIYVGLVKDLKEDSRSFNDVRDNLDSYSFNQIYNIFTKPSNVHNKRFATIKKKHLDIIKLPNLYQLYHIKQSDFPKEKYIIYNNTKYFPDIIIKNEYFNNIYIIISNNEKIQKISNFIYSIPYNFKYADCYIDNDYYKQKLKYLLITNGIGLTTKGKEYLFSNNIDFFEVYKYYLDLSIYLINVYVSTKNNEDRINLYSSIANNVFYNLYIMNKTGKFPCIVDYGYKSTLHYNYDHENYWYRSKVENNISVNVLNSIIEVITEILNTIKKETIK